MSETKVVNIRDLPEGWRDDPDYVYIGRANGRYRLSASKWGNPFKVRKESERDSSLEQYRENVLANTELMASLEELRGKTLVCWCKPKACHGDVLIELLEAGD